jgi:hypothetical protein
MEGINSRLANARNPSELVLFLQVPRGDNEWSDIRAVSVHALVTRKVR